VGKERRREKKEEGEGREKRKGEKEKKEKGKQRERAPTRFTAATTGPVEHARWSGSTQCNMQKEKKKEMG
jgi:hypothetical protein